jgi:hypothetical protein
MGRSHCVSSVRIIETAGSHDVRWCNLNNKERKFLIGDRYGRLALLSINLYGGTTLTLMALGQVGLLRFRWLFLR